MLRNTNKKQDRSWGKSLGGKPLFEKFPRSRYIRSRALAWRSTIRGWQQSCSSTVLLGSTELHWTEVCDDPPISLWSPRADWCGFCSLAYAEMRCILARFVWNFDLELCEESAYWAENQTEYVLWDKPGLFVRLLARKTEWSLDKMLFPQQHSHLIFYLW